MVLPDTKSFKKEHWSAVYVFLHEKLRMADECLDELKKMDPIGECTVTKDDRKFWSQLKQNIIFLLGQVPDRLNIRLFVEE